MANLNEVIREVVEVRGSVVNVFGQQTKMNDSVSPYLVDTVDVLKAFSSYEVDMIVEEYDEENDEYNETTTNDIEEYLEYLDNIYGLKEVNHDNSYNWNSMLSNEIDFITYKCNDEYYVKMMVHRGYGDVRCNYTDYCLLKFNDENDFITELSDCAVNDAVVIDDVTYSLYISPLNESIEVSVNDDDGYYNDCCTICGCFDTEDEVIEAIKEELELA